MTLSGDQPYFSPGGDGGILVLTQISQADAYAVANDLAKLLSIESDHHTSMTKVQSRIGLHYGQVALYENAEGLLRPTGLDLFVADEIAGDDVARQGTGVVFTEPLKESIGEGSIKDFDREFEELPALHHGPAAHIKRFRRRVIQ